MQNGDNSILSSVRNFTILDTMKAIPHAVLDP